MIISYKEWNNNKPALDAIDWADETDICFRKDSTYLMLSPYLGERLEYQSAWNVTVFTTTSSIANMKHILDIIYFAHTNCNIQRLHIEPVTKQWSLFRTIFNADENNNINILENLQTLKEKI